MIIVGKVIIYIIMLCAIAGAVAYIKNQESELGNEFAEGINTIGPLFIPIAGAMAAVPYLSIFIKAVFGPLFTALGADPAIAATTIFACDMGGYQLSSTLAQSNESWIMAMLVGFMAGPTLTFTIPIALSMLNKSDHKYFILGIIPGIISVPFGVLVSSVILHFTNPAMRTAMSSTSPLDYTLNLNWMTIVGNLTPLVIICVLLAVCFWYFPDKMISGFIKLGKVITAGLTLVLLVSILEYFTGIFSMLLGGWGFEPIIADEENQMRALEVCGNIGMMLAGAYPMVYLIQKYLGKGLESLGKKIGLGPVGTTGVLAASANLLALFRLVKDMTPADKVKSIAYAVCGCFVIGDFLVYTANFQPSMIVEVMLGKFIGGLIGIFIATKLCVPKALALEEKEKSMAA